MDTAGFELTLSLLLLETLTLDKDRVLCAEVLPSSQLAVEIKKFQSMISTA
jgi:hypothetical protein